MIKSDATITLEAARQYSPLVLAFIGDAVYSLYVRKQLCLTTDYKTGELQLLTSKIVSAHGQADLYLKIKDSLSEEEREIFMRGRNAKKGTKSKNATVAEYNVSTGLEALLGYLYLTGQNARMELLMQEAFEKQEVIDK